MKKLVITLGVIFLTQFAYAETCPTVHDIKSDLLTDWRFHDSDDGRPLTPKKTEAVVQSIAKFALAEWSGNEREGEIHCYYRDLDGSDLEAYLSKKNYFPNHSTHRWYQVSGHMHCAAGVDKCIFSNSVEPQLANG